MCILNNSFRSLASIFLSARCPNILNLESRVEVGALDQGCFHCQWLSTSGLKKVTKNRLLPVIDQISDLSDPVTTIEYLISELLDVEKLKLKAWGFCRLWIFLNGTFQLIQVHWHVTVTHYDSDHNDVTSKSESPHEYLNILNSKISFYLGITCTLFGRTYVSNIFGGGVRLGVLRRTLQVTVVNPESFLLKIPGFPRLSGSSMTLN